MDPTKALITLVVEMSSKDASPARRREWADKLRGLANWLESGGFVPNMQQVLERLAATWKRELGA